jgi:hypothetical protein
MGILGYGGACGASADSQTEKFTSTACPGIERNTGRLWARRWSLPAGSILKLDLDHGEPADWARDETLFSVQRPLKELAARSGKLHGSPYARLGYAGGGNVHDSGIPHQNSIPGCARMPWSRSGCFTAAISVTRSANATSAGGAFRPVMTR